MSILPAPIGICSGDIGTANFTASGVCSGTYEFEVSAGGNVIQAWSTSSVFNANPTSSTLYTVSARCSACPSTVVSDTFSIFVTPQPVVSGLTTVCHGSGTTLTASNYSGPIGWYDNSGTQLSATDTYTTPTLTSDQTYNVQVSNNFASGAVGSILITECGLAGFVPGSDNDYIEISNLYSVPINTAGWKVAVSSSYTNINSVNSTVWNLPSTFAPCSIQSKQDNSSASNYWGSNIFWNPSQKGWAIIIDDVGAVMDFVCWGWTTAEIAGFNVTIAGFPVTLGTQWTGASCPSACGSTAAPMSITRIGGTDNNVAADFVCQATSLNMLNPGLPCGWNPVSVACSYPTTVVVDMPPTASNPAPLSISCYADLPAADPLVVTTEADNAGIPTVTFLSESSNGLTCPEIITRTYRVTDTCSNYVDVTHTITINDLTPPVIDAPPADLTVSCIGDVPSAVDLNWTDNCDGSGSISPVETSNGSTCPEIITRTWTYTDNCGNTDTKTQVITVHDQILPTIDLPSASLTFQCIDLVPLISTLNWTDNCDGNGVLNGVEQSNGLSCPEIITRTWTYTDLCGNNASQTQIITVMDQTPPTASTPPSQEFEILPSPDPSVISDASDNCGTPNVFFVSDVSDGGFCPEHVSRTYRVMDDCGNHLDVTQLLIIGDNIPVASFIPSEFELTTLDTEVSFTNTSSGASTYSWDFGDGTGSNAVSPVHLFPDSESGGYMVELIAFSELGCSDTMYIPIQIWEELIYFIPNSFTPDGDQFNQSFKPVFVSGFDPYDFHMLIFNRWGEIVWESFDAEAGWDGTYAINGRLVPQGIYTWRIEFKVEKNDERKRITGHIQLMR